MAKVYTQWAHAATFASRSNTHSVGRTVDSRLVLERRSPRARGHDGRAKMAHTRTLRSDFCFVLSRDHHVVERRVRDCHRCMSHCVVTTNFSLLFSLRISFSFSHCEFARDPSADDDVALVNLMNWFSFKWMWRPHRPLANDTRVSNRQFANDADILI